MYVKCADLVKHGEAFYYDKNGKIKDKFPKESRNSNGICHVRPHARNSKDKYFLPMTDKETGINSYTKQSFWFNKSFIFKILKDSEWIINVFEYSIFTISSWSVIILIIK